MMQYTTSTILLIAIVGQANGQAPEFCNGRDCPPYTVIESNEVYELREYEASTWVAASGDGSNKRLFRDCLAYIKGSNAAELEIAMTIPVIKRYSIQEDSGVENENMTFFYLTMSDPPQPLADNVQIVQMPQMRVYVKSYGGWSFDNTVSTHLQELLAALPPGTSVDLENAYRAGYSHPRKMTGRHNEVWLIEQ